MLLRPPKKLLPAESRAHLAEPRRGLSHAVLDESDALLLLLPFRDHAGTLKSLPFGELLARRFGRADRAAGQVVAVALPTRAHTLVAIGLLPDDASEFAQLDLAGRMVKAVMPAEPATITIAAPGLTPARERAAVEAGVAAALAASFDLPSFVSRRKRRPHLTQVVPVTRAAIDARRLAATAEGNDLARWLTALPPNLLTPGSFRRHATGLARRERLGARFLGESELRRAGAGAFLAVVRGSGRRDAGILHLRYRPRGKSARAPIALVGKGICFDTGGTNLKAHKGMLEMHTDMAGSAVALATLLALSRVGYDRPVDAWLTLAENRIGPDAYLPQEVVTAANGTTIQVIHTDAEGRMALADALALASRSRPAAIIDLATLTGACVNALTERYSGAFTNRPQDRERIERAGRVSGERVWCFPMDEDFDTEIESKVADVIQCPVEGKGDHIYAARFLQRFVGKGIPWLHLDLSSATRHGGLAHVPSEITGFGVRYLLSLLLDEGWPQAAGART